MAKAVSHILGEVKQVKLSAIWISSNEAASQDMHFILANTFIRYPALGMCRNANFSQETALHTVASMCACSHQKEKLGPLH